MSPCRLLPDGSPDKVSPEIDELTVAIPRRPKRSVRRLWVTRGGRGSFLSLVHLSIFPTLHHDPCSSEDEGQLSGPPARPSRELRGWSEREDGRLFPAPSAAAAAPAVVPERTVASIPQQLPSQRSLGTEL